MILLHYTSPLEICTSVHSSLNIFCLLPDLLVGYSVVFTLFLMGENCVCMIIFRLSTIIKKTINGKGVQGS